MTQSFLEPINFRDADNTVLADGGGVGKEVIWLGLLACVIKLRGKNLKMLKFCFERRFPVAVL